MRPRPPSLLTTFRRTASTQWVAGCSSLPSEAIEDYERSATAVADAVVADPTHAGRDGPLRRTAMQNDACYTTVAETHRTLGVPSHAGVRRRSTGSSAIALEGRTWGDGDFLSGPQVRADAAILQSPSFIYIIEVGEPDMPTPVTVGCDPKSWRPGCRSSSRAAIRTLRLARPGRRR